MRKSCIFSSLIALLLAATQPFAQEGAQEPANAEHPPIDFSGFIALGQEAEEYRQTRLVSFKEFKRLAAEEGAIILDTRSRQAYEQRHVAGAVHLNFSDFTEEKLAKIIPAKDSPILIYCNNNFRDDPVAFPTKKVELALNVPTFINLYGYGYKNIYELKDFLSVSDPMLELGGTLQLGESGK